MTTVQSRPLDEIWKTRLDLASRREPELYESIDVVRNSSHASAIRATLKDLGASAVFCVQGVPTIVILSVDEYERDTIINLHAALWNQGLASLLLVMADDTVRAFSLSRTPYYNPGDEFERRCLVETLHATADALALKNIIYGAESGRFWEEYAEFFKPKERVDQVLLENLTRSHELLYDANLSSDAAQALLIQTMFIAYLEDRQIIGEDYFKAASDNRNECFSSLLQSGKVQALNELFASLREDFNGDLFVAPCSFESSAKPPRLNRDHLNILARFRVGQEEMGAGQLRFWGYNFKHIPIELISAVYDRFLGEREAERRNHGAYYTPMFLADTVVSQVWDVLPSTTKGKGDFLDPACGSGVFLVRSFQRLCEHWREKHNSQTIRWDSLKNILLRLHGWDLNGSAVRVAVFSLYIALLEQVSPPDIRSLIRRGKVLPELWGRTLKCQDFFTVDPGVSLVDVVIGNPPWMSRRGPSRPSTKWCALRNLPMPGKEDAWAFTWKSIHHLRSDGIIAFLLPAMGFLHNHADKSVEARNTLISTTRIKRIVNFADLRFQLFEGAVRPAALVIFSKADAEHLAYRFEYWAPKADLNLKVKRLITLSRADKSFITSKVATNDPLIFKRRLWMNEPEGKLFNYLSGFSRLGKLVSIYKDIARRGDINDQWVIGDGFKQAVPKRISDPSYDKTRSDHVGLLPHITIEQLPPLALNAGDLESASKWHTRMVHRKGIQEAYLGTRILIPRGVQIRKGRLRACFSKEDFTFSSIIQGLTVPAGQEQKGKLLTALLNSRTIFWFAFHGTASLGSDRPEIQKSELMHVPFPTPEEMPEPKRARKAEKALVKIIERVASKTAPFTLEGEPDSVFTTIDELSYEYFCLSNEEIALIEDSVRYILPAVQPHQGSFSEIWKTPTTDERGVYAQTLVRALGNWFGNDQVVNVCLEAHNNDLAILRLTLCPKNKETPYTERGEPAVRDLLARLFSHIHQPLPGNFQLMPDFRIFQGNALYLVKPMQRRFWLRSSALADAHNVVLDLQDYAGSAKKQDIA
ncbi:HsdM family class I SAM-dependent methyltransferase [Nitrospina watsonii]|uniref:Site-specific DNA-methyltransferase (Adenine-specific) n=1 Tax=Nitrospina watsonii TaxID=1323948 RepID=A0ABN8VUH8_9BACT|nr:N-6 DNA methylase [Nitrospina watsonii]CAI2717512.1 Site-specific DNA-methyltransferase (adenine-specific) [Nitrospina watsonii]